MDGEDRAMRTGEGRSEIDTRAPFHSVKEAIVLFGERVLAGELYAKKLRRMQGEGNNGLNAKLGSVTVELEETKQCLEKAQEEGTKMSNTLSSMKEELERTKQELQHLKERCRRDLSEKRHRRSEEIPPSSVTVVDIEDVKFEAEDSTNKFEIKNRYVTFAHPPSVTGVAVPQGSGEVLERSASMEKKKKKPFIPLIKGIFSKKKQNSPP